MKLLFTNASNTAGYSSFPLSPVSPPVSAHVTARFFGPLLKKALKILKSAPVSEKISETEVELVLLNDADMQVINKQTRGLDKPTDVLSFASREVVPGQPANTPNTLGQILISIPAAQRNADEMDQSLQEELRFLFIHGLLHILGYDHQTHKDETEMMTLAYQILGRPPYKRLKP